MSTPTAEEREILSNCDGLLTLSGLRAQKESQSRAYLLGHRVQIDGKDGSVVDSNSRTLVVRFRFGEVKRFPHKNGPTIVWAR